MPDSPELSSIPGLDLRPTIDPESASALDGLLKEKETAQDNPPEIPAKTDDAPATPPAKADDAPADPPKADDAPAVPATPATPPAADDDFGVTLPPYTKPKTGEAFEKVKSIARERISAVEKERDDLKRERDELSTRVSQGLPKEVETELKELRSFRDRMDVEASAEFKQFETEISSNVESIYARLKEAGFTDEHVEQIKKMGGPGEVDWDSIAGKLPAQLKRFIDAKLVENETFLDKKRRAMDEAKKNASEYLATKQSESKEARTRAAKEVETRVGVLRPGLKWLEVRKAKDGATDAEKAAVESHNKLVTESESFLKDAITDDSPELRSILAVGYVQLLKTRADAAAEKAASDAKITDLNTKLKAATDQLEKIKKSSTHRLKDIPSTSTPDAKKPGDFTVSGAEALDTLAKQVINR